MKTIKVQFTNQEQLQLAAKLELPIDQQPYAFALFAHCFTCSKDLNAVRHISQALTQSGIAVLRFDFTGLGQSQGAFADTNFSSNVSDLVAAAQFLTENYSAPQLLIGHSLGGAAVLLAAHQIHSVRAVATIGAPFNPAHVQHLLSGSHATIEAQGLAEVNIGGRSFTIKKQFIEDLQGQTPYETVHHLNKALLILHAPQDKIVSIDNATEIYKAAQHPRSFISLDGAKHLLPSGENARYVGDMITHWSKRYVKKPKNIRLRTDAQTIVHTTDSSFTTDIKVGKHQLIADEPESVGGYDFGPSPYGLLTAALGACTSMTLHMYAKRKKWDLQDVKVHLNHSKIYAQDCADCETQKGKIDVISRSIELKGNLDEKQKQRLLEIADKCPVHRTLHQEVKITTTLHNRI